MLIIKPAPDNDSAEIKTLNAYLDDKPCGYIRFRLRGYIMVITDLSPLMSDPMGTGGDDGLYVLLDPIIRALGSYGLNHSCYYAECAEPMLYPTLSKLRFSMSDGMMRSNLSMILGH